MRLINADGPEWKLMEQINRLKIDARTGGAPSIAETARAKIEAYETALKLMKEEETVDALPIGTGCEYRADNFDIVKKRCEADPEVEVFTITRKEESNPAPDCPWR